MPGDLKSSQNPTIPAAPGTQGLGGTDIKAQLSDIWSYSTRIRVRKKMRYLLFSGRVVVEGYLGTPFTDACRVAMDLAGENVNLLNTVDLKEERTGLFLLTDRETS